MSTVAAIALIDRTSTLTARQEQIRRAATELFAEHGYRAVGMRMIADAVGIRTSSLYYHFPSKQDILYSISLEVTRDFVEQGLPLLETAGSRIDRLGALLRAHILYFTAHRLEESVGKRELRELTPEHYAEVREHRRSYQRRIQNFIAEGVDAGDFSVDDASLAGLALLDMINGINGWYRPDGPLDVETLADRYVALSLQLLGARGTRNRTRPKGSG